jgi:ribosomal protein S18 acetylase RimI-like enzyme
MRIFTLQPKSLTSDGVADLNALLREFRADREPPSHRHWRKILAQKDVKVFTVRESGKIVGMAILRWHELPVGRVGNLEDVVVGRKQQGKGYGSGLVRGIIAFARKNKMAYIDLTTRPERKAANKLYQKFGWEKRKTNVYRLLL